MAHARTVAAPHATEQNTPRRSGSGTESKDDFSADERRRKLCRIRCDKEVVGPLTLAGTRYSRAHLKAAIPTDRKANGSWLESLERTSMFRNDANDVALVDQPEMRMIG